MRRRLKNPIKASNYKEKSRCEKNTKMSQKIEKNDKFQIVKPGARNVLQRITAAAC
jgi:hypothetical protein